MSNAIDDIKKKRGRPKTGIGSPVLVRFTPDVLAAIDAKIAGAAGKPIGRPEMVRQCVTEKLKKDGFLE